jgi:hypothetical protein
MYVVIQRAAELPGAGLLPIAGQPLIARQLQWMRALGCRNVAVEIGTDEASMEMARFLKSESALGADVVLVLAGRRLTAQEIARRAGFPEDARVAAIPATVVGGGDLWPKDATASSCAALLLQPPAALAGRLEGACVYVLGSGGETADEVDAPGWGVTVRSYADAHALGVAALDGSLSSIPGGEGAGIRVHGAERSPGVWAARGAIVEPGAEIVPPVLLGIRAVVCAGARVGPSVLLGNGAVVEPGTVLSEALVKDGTIVGEKLKLSHVALEPRAITQFSTGRRAAVDETLVLDARGSAPGPAWWARLLALVALAVLSPGLAFAWAFAGWDGLARLVDVVRGRCFLVGVSTWRGPRPRDASAELFAAALAVPRGFLDVEAALTPPDADAVSRLRARLWYGLAKKPSVDGVFLLRRLCRALGLGPAAHPARGPRPPCAVELP